jgi:twitching motility protein PilT
VEVGCPQCQATIPLTGRQPAAAEPQPPLPTPAPSSHRSEAPAAAAGSGAAQPEMDALLRSVVERKASDLHICTGSPPLLRLDGEIEVMSGRGSVTAVEAERLLLSITPPGNLEEYAQRHDTDFAYEIPGVARFRCNLYRDRKGPGGVFRAIPSKIMTAEDMAIPRELLEVCQPPMPACGLRPAAVGPITRDAAEGRRSNAESRLLVHVHHLRRREAVEPGG